MCVLPASRHFHIWSGWLWATGRRFRLVFASRRCALFPSLSHPDLVLLLLFNTVHSQMKRAMTSLPKNIKYQPSCLAPDQAWPLQLLCQDMFSESEPEQVSTKMQKKTPGQLTASMGSNSSWQTSWSSQFSDHNCLDLMIIDQPSKCARSLVALRLLSAAALGTPGQWSWQSGFSKT